MPNPVSDPRLPWRDSLLPGLIRGYLALVWRTSRIATVGVPEADLRRRSPGPLIGAFWHDRMLWPAWAFRGPGYAVLVSDHADGRGSPAPSAASAPRLSSAAACAVAPPDCTTRRA